jgi:hypothetical protein
MPVPHRELVHLHNRVEHRDLRLLPIAAEQGGALDQPLVLQQVVAIGEVEFPSQVVPPRLALLFRIDRLAVDGAHRAAHDRKELGGRPEQPGELRFLRRLDVDEVHVGSIGRKRLHEG